MAKVVLEDVSKSFGSSKVVDDLNLKINDKEFVTLLGPSGCGKTTTLRCIAGLETLDSGKIVVDDQVVNDKPPQDRDMAMVFQNYALYPFMTVRNNITFPLRLHKVPKDQVERKLQEVSEMLHITHLLPRKPKELSGGEQQRVAVGRALVRDPKLFLLDEPFSNLDAKLRIETRSEIKKLQKELGITTIFVTHDQAEAMALADRIAVMNLGSLQQIGTPAETYGKPANVMVAQFLGSPTMNVLDARYTKPDTIMIKDGVDIAIRRPEASKLASLSGVGEIRIGFRPEDAEFEIGGQEGIPTEVSVEEPSGTHMLLTLKVGESVGQVKVVMPPSFAPDLGTKGMIRVKQGKLNIFDARSGNRIE
ncbi:MAG: ABC transporter ATP-binding protein [Nitrososphaerota archaeon]|nr:ABC transporter ATP-binding protein [Nitrososphaerota archaeon]